MEHQNAALTTDSNVSKGLKLEIHNSDGDVTRLSSPTPKITIKKDDGLSSREAEKIETLTRQRENYLNYDSSNQNGFFSKCKGFIKALFSGVDSHTERLLYLFAFETFFIFLTYTHYPYLDKKNKFLTPIVMGGETSLLGQTITQLFKWNQNRSLDSNTYKNIVADEEKNMSGIDGLNSNLNIKSGTCIDVNSNNRGMHSRNPSNIDKIFSNISPGISASTQLDIVDTDQYITNHLKFLTWGAINGLLCSYWIEFLLLLFEEKKIFCVLLDQSLGTVIFQTLYSLFVCLWDGEVEVGSESTVDLTWNNFTKHYATMLWKYIKLSYMIWPIISLLSFTILREDWIFPVNCIFSTIFSVVLGM